MRYRQGWDGLPVWQDGTGREYERLVGGLAWPWEDLPGWLVVLGEERMVQQDGRRAIRVVHAWEGRQGNHMVLPLDMLAQAAAVQQELAFTLWISPRREADAALVQLFHKETWEEPGPKRENARVSLRTPPRYAKATAFALYDRLLERRTLGEKSFHVGAWRHLAGELALPRQSDKSRCLEEFPAVAATLYALAWLEFSARGTEGHTGAKEWEVPSQAGY